MLRRSLVLLACWGLVALLGSAAFAQDKASIPSRVELHPIASLTLSDQQLLTGEKGGTPVTASGEFRIAQGSGRLPVVVLMHGSGGIGANIGYFALQEMQSWINSMLAIAAASMIYVAVADLIPGLHKRTDIKATIEQVLLIGSGVFLIWLVGMFVRQAH